MPVLTSVKTRLINKEITFYILQEVSVGVNIDLLRLLFLARLLIVAKSSDIKAAFSCMHTRKYIWLYRTFTYISLCMSAYRCLGQDDD